MCVCVCLSVWCLCVVSSDVCVCWQGLMFHNSVQFYCEWESNPVLMKVFHYMNAGVRMHDVKAANERHRRAIQALIRGQQSLNSISLSVFLFLGDVSAVISCVYWEWHTDDEKTSKPWMPYYRGMSEEPMHKIWVSIRVHYSSDPVSLEGQFAVLKHSGGCQISAGNTPSDVRLRVLMSQ